MTLERRTTTKKRHSDIVSTGPARAEVRRRRQARVATADVVYDAVDQAATDMGVSRAALCVDVAECAHTLPGRVQGSAQFDRFLIRVRHPPGMRLSMPNALALLYHEVGHLADIAGQRRMRALGAVQRVACIILAELVGVGLLASSIVVAVLISPLLCDDSICAAAMKWSLVCGGFVLALAVGVSVGLWCEWWTLWRRLTKRISHDMEKTANRLAADALLARNDDDGIGAVAVMLVSLQQYADRGQKATSGHPPAREEQRALVDHLTVVHGLDIAFGPRQGPRGRRRLTVRRAVTDAILWDGEFDGLPRRTRRYHGPPRRYDGGGGSGLPEPSLLDLLLGRGRAIFSSTRRLVARLSRRWARRPATAAAAPRTTKRRA
ncbi:hypothetical protein pdul_cds_466 [Pandoravirus dulcis]|uniref:Uncharacterized protein n=1 Tax=Pandoravirus dulcis TaxID=1349409 RepID=S4VQJ9_9VIRU|nr:hypothetical protein pdul_cds_466 [Pandoravirus dulcis]AGO82537.1 hypothetical protein pdul_cds_466 [Pandoravirus dulcis]